MYIVQAQLLMSAPPPDIFLTHPSGSSNTPKQSSSSVFFIITLYKAPLYQTASANVVISFDNWLKKLKKISGPQAIFLRIHISSWNGGYNTDTIFAILNSIHYTDICRNHYHQHDHDCHWSHSSVQRVPKLTIASLSSSLLMLPSLLWSNTLSTFY